MNNNPTPTFKKIALAFAFSPTLEALLCEAKRIKETFNAELILIHIGKKNKEEEALLNQYLEKWNFNREKVHIIWKEGKVVKTILKTCKEKGVDLLIEGAKKEEDFLTYYKGSVAREMIRKKHSCSILMLTDPSINPRPFNRFMLGYENNKNTFYSLSLGLNFAKKENPEIFYIVKENLAFDIATMVSDQVTEKEYKSFKRKLLNEEVQNINDVLQNLETGDLNINIKLLTGKPGFTLQTFAHQSKADILIINAPRQKLNIIDRIFPHDIEYILKELPCNLLIVQPPPE